MRKFITTAAVLASFAAAIVPATASARDHDRYDNNYRNDRHDNRGYYNDRRDDRRYRSRGHYRQNGYNGYNSRDRRGYAYGGQNYRCSNNGTTGTILGAIAGGLVGNQVAGRGDRTLGTVLGGGAGALAGRAIDKSGSRRC